MEQYYSEAGPDYAAWSPEFNMHFGYYRAGANPLRSESMLEQMNVEVLDRLRLAANPDLMLIALGCGLGATLRSIARRLPHARLLGLTRVPWQVEHAHALNVAAGCEERVRVIQGDYEARFFSGSFNGAYALESSCMGMALTKVPSCRKRTGCCGQVDVLSLQTAFSATAGFPAWCNSAFTAALRVLGHRGTSPASPVYGAAGEARLH